MMSSSEKKNRIMLCRNQLLLIRLLTFALRSQGAYSAHSVAVHMFGFVQIERRRKLDGVRFGYSEIKGIGLLVIIYSGGPRFWVQDCCQYHPAKDGDGWIENKGSLVFDRLSKVEIPRAFVCAESRIFDVSEWATCQVMSCKPNTHRPSFHVNMVGLERSNSSRYPWDLDAEMMEEDDEFDIWLQQALASGRFCETSKRRKSWSPFILPQKKGKNQWRRSS